MCDGCYNRLTYEASTRNIALAKAKKELLLQQEKEKEEDEKFELLNGATTTGSPTCSPKTGGGVLSSETDNGVSDLKETLGEIEEAFRERGEKLKDLSKKGADLENVRILPLLPLSSSFPRLHRNILELRNKS